ncbi:hypothetical protein DTO027I6_8087 [Penicillium roqueforti]|nr:hypothetical protein CBS147337_6184 [Penicillium roqueforti]KAI2676020.1 hypothetical protein CBS147355_6201 [Penicillium roqueforti]KAI2679293.1 hypothetical protein LCP963914a_7392 [Penicillium roqueforti]KAI2707694.1 hypothetical protein CBS147332_6752 [Penicillium roqueforti]KAI3112166.1 hypothetical protein CBS147331_4720 [Penicillium roqueforti]
MAGCEQGNYFALDVKVTPIYENEKNIFMAFLYQPSHMGFFAAASDSPSSAPSLSSPTSDGASLRVLTELPRSLQLSVEALDVNRGNPMSYPLEMMAGRIEGRKRNRPITMVPPRNAAIGKGKPATVLDRYEEEPVDPETSNPTGIQTPVESIEHDGAGEGPFNVRGIFDATPNDD